MSRRDAASCQRITLIAALVVGGLSVAAPQSRADHFHVNCNGHGFLGGAAASPGVTCNNWSRNYGNYQECPGWANVYLATRFDFHRHNAHNWCG